MPTYVDDFKPTFLYIKRHRVTGLLYFGKTIRSNPTKYPGSGEYWKSHRAIHGEDVETIWYCLFTDREELSRFALMCSEQWNIVKSDSWANLAFENGLDGGAVGKRGPQARPHGPLKKPRKPYDEAGRNSRKRVMSIEERHGRSKRIMCEGIEFTSQGAAAKHFGISQPAVSKRLLSTSKKWSGWSIA